MQKREEAALLKMDDGANKKKGKNDEQEVTEGIATPADENWNRLVKSAELLSDSEALQSGKTQMNCKDLTCTVATSGNRELKQVVNTMEGSSHSTSTKKQETMSDHPNCVKHDISCDTQESDNYRASAKAFGDIEDRLDSDGNALDQKSVADLDHSAITGLFSSAIARMAVAKSHHMAALNVETFGDDWSDGDANEDGDDDDETV